MNTDDKLTRIADDIGSIKVSQARMEQDVANHIRRTDIAEKNIERLVRHDNMWAGALKLVTIVGLLVGIVAGIAKLVSP